MDKYYDGDDDFGEDGFATDPGTVFDDDYAEYPPDRKRGDDESVGILGFLKLLIFGE